MYLLYVSVVAHVMAIPLLFVAASVAVAVGPKIESWLITNQLSARSYASCARGLETIKWPIN